MRCAQATVAAARWRAADSSGRPAAEEVAAAGNDSLFRPFSWTGLTGLLDGQRPRWGCVSHAALGGKGANG